MALADLFTDIADAIREKDGTTDTIVANDFPERILGIETGETGYKIDLSVDPPGSGTVAGSGRASAGMKVSATVNVNEGNKFIGWYENGSMVYRNTSYSFNVNRNRILKARIKVYDFWFKKAVLPHVTSWKGITYGDGKFVAVAGEGNYPANYFAYSTDGINWTKSNELAASAYAGRIAYGDGKFVAVSTSAVNDIVYCSTDGISWTSIRHDILAAWQDITYGDGKFVAVSDDKFSYSSDGLNWSKIDIEVGGNPAIAYGDGKFVVVAGTVSVYSTDGINWTQVELPVEVGEYPAIAYGDGKFVAVAGTVSVYSTDGINWTQVELPVDVSHGLIAYGDGKFVVANGTAVLKTNVVIYSTDGINWTETYFPINDKWSGISYGGGKFVAVARDSSNAAYSAQRDQIT